MKSSYAMEKSIVVDHLSFTGHIKGVSFTIQKSDVVGLIGPHDSGKTMLMRIITGLVESTSGFVSVLEFDPFLKSPDFLKQISFLNGQKNQLLKSSPPIETLEITKEIYGLSEREFSKNLRELTQYINDPRLLDALIYKPKVILLDEPNLDLESIYEYNNKNESTTLLATEKIDNLINFARRVIIMDKGQILFDGALDEVITKFAKEKVIKAKLSSEIDAKSVGEIGTVKSYTYPYLCVSASRSTVSLAAAEMIQNLPIINLTIDELSIEEIIHNMKA